MGVGLKPVPGQRGLSATLPAPMAHATSYLLRDCRAIVALRLTDLLRSARAPLMRAAAGAAASTIGCEAVLGGLHGLESGPEAQA